MKSTFPIIATLVCALGLSACGGGSDPAPAAPVVVQPAFAQSETVKGSGTEAANADLVTLHSTIWLYDASAADKKGAKVSSTLDSKQPSAFTLGTGAVLPVIDQAVLGMKAGGTRVLTVPSSQGYGAVERAALPDYTDAAGVKYTYAKVPANTPLLIELTLVTVTKAAVPVVVPPPTALVPLDLVAGSGTEAVAGKALTVNYTLWIYNGTVTDFKGVRVESNLDNGTAPLAFTQGDSHYLTGWNQGVIGMKVGGTRRLTVPPSLGYGATAVPAKAATATTKATPEIPANSTLIFEIQLLSVK